MEHKNLQRCDIVEHGYRAHHHHSDLGSAYVHRHIGCPATCDQPAYLYRPPMGESPTSVAKWQAELHERELPDYSAFRTGLTELLNKHSMENGSDTPDFILADHLTRVLKAFDKTARKNSRYRSS